MKPALMYILYIPSSAVLKSEYR